MKPEASNRKTTTLATALPVEMKILIAGFGSVGRRHFRNLQTLGVTDVSFFRTSRSTLETGEIEGRRVFTDLDLAMAERPDAVIIANPTSLHVPVAAVAVRAGCAVFVEKPLSDSLDGCDELVRSAESQKIVTMVGCQYRFHPLLRQLRQQLEGREYGNALSAYAEYGDNVRQWHPWEDHRQSYSARAALGGGAILTLIHPIDYLYWLFGPARDVHASTRKVGALETDVPDDIADMTVHFSGGVIGQIHLDFVQTPAVHTLTVVCETARATLDFQRGTLCWRSAADVEGRVTGVPEDFDRNAMFVAELTHFLACVEQRRASEVPVSDGRAVLEIALRARDDADQRRR